MKNMKCLVIVLIFGVFIFFAYSISMAARGCETPDFIYWFDATAYDKAPGERLDISLTVHYEDLDGIGGGPNNMYFSMKIVDKKVGYPFSGVAYDIGFMDYSQQFSVISSFLENTALPVVLGCDATGTDPLNPCPKACQPAPDAYPDPILCTEEDEPYFSLKSVEDWLEDDAVQYGAESAAFHFMFMDFAIAVEGLK